MTHQKSILKRPPARLGLTLLAALLPLAPLLAQTAAPATQPVPLLNPDHQTLITLHTKDESPQQVFDDIAKQAGITFQGNQANLWAGVEGSVTVDYDKQPFWQIVHELALSYDLTPRGDSSPRHIVLTHSANSPWLRTPCIIAGPLLLSIDSISYNRSIRYENTADPQTQFSLRLSGFTDPNARLVNSSTVLTVNEATDDHGNSLAPAANLANPNIYSGGFATGRGLAINITVPLVYPAANPGTTITKIKGSLAATMQTKVDTITFDDLKTASDTTKSAGDISITLHDVNATQPRMISIRLSIKSAKTAEPRGPRIPGRRTDDPLAFARTGELIDAQGHAFLNHGVSSYNNSNGQSELTLNFGIDGPLRRTPAGGESPAFGPVKLTFEIPLETKDITIPIELTDIKMP